MDETQQRALFSQAVDLIGGIGATARALDINERNVRRILRGDTRLHTGLLGDMASALLAHANQCRQLERQLSPLYSGNLTAAQAKPPLHDGKGPMRKRIPQDQIDEIAARLGIARHVDTVAPGAVTIRMAGGSTIEFAGDEDEPMRGFEIGEVSTMTPFNELPLFGWTEGQYQRAAQSCGLAFDYDWFPNAYAAVMVGHAISNPAISALQNIKRTWLRRGGPIEGPSGAILLSPNKP